MGDFKLSASLKGHEDDVRAVVFPTSKTIYSASRDGSVRQWTLTSPQPPTYDDTIAAQSTSFVNALAFIRPSKEYPDGLIVSAGKDTIIDIRQPGRSPDQNAERLLLGHAHNVCALDVSTDGRMLVSGGWDKQARIWDVERAETVVELKGHDASVWAVLAYDEQHIITGCADKHIRIFSQSGKLLQDLAGLPDVVRALCKLPTDHWSGAAFASAGNDQVIRLWTIDGVEVAQLHGHEAFIYSLAVLPNGDIVSSSEDRTARIWRDGNPIQTITHPAISVWTVAVCSETGDFVTGASDKTVRVFTRDASRQADPQTLAAFEESVRASTIPQQTVGGGEQINKEQLPGPAFLQQKSGTKEGQVQMIREDDGSVTAHQWSAGAAQWLNIGTVVDSAASSGRKVSYKGKDYDYVFDVDIEDGKPPLKLPYNSNQNPYEVAQQFIANNELPITYLDQVANFITTNAQGATLGAGAPPQPSEAPGSDPWGSNNRYRPGEAGAPQTQGDSRPRALPQTQYLSITSANLPAIRKKIGELNQSTSPDSALSTDDLANLDALVKQLQSSPKDPKPQSNQLAVVLKIATQWAPASRLPGLDLLRLCAVAPAFLTHTSAGTGTIIDNLASADIFAPATDRPNNTMLAVRVLANMFTTEQGRLIADGCFEQILQLTEPFATTTNKNLATAIATLHINFAVLLTSGAPATESSAREQRAAAVVNQVVDLLDRGGDGETVYRALVALGTLMALGDQFRKEVAQAKSVKALLDSVEKGSAGKESRVKAVVTEMRDQLR